jgi:ribosomal protein L21E
LPKFEVGQLVHIKKDAKHANSEWYNPIKGRDGIIHKVFESTAIRVHVLVQRGSSSEIWTVHIDDLEIVEPTNSYYLKVIPNLNDFDG